LIAPFQVDRNRLLEVGRVAGSALRVHDVLKEWPVASLQVISRRSGLSFPRHPPG
jgi:hypothetical protein